MENCARVLIFYPTGFILRPGLGYIKAGKIFSVLECPRFFGGFTAECNYFTGFTNGFMGQKAGFTHSEGLGQFLGNGGWGNHFLGHPFLREGAHVSYGT